MKLLKNQHAAFNKSTITLPKGDGKKNSKKHIKTHKYKTYKYHDIVLAKDWAE